MFEIIPGDQDSRVVIHVPHSSTFIPAKLIPEFLLTPPQLAIEAQLMADIHTDKLALAVYEQAAKKPWLFINRTSRLVVDPERFPDDTEVMNKVGMGVVYTKTSDQKPLRGANEAKRLELVSQYFEPYSRALEQLVDEIFTRHGSATIIDLHSYAVEPLGYEINKHGPRPNICLGVDEFHTLAELASLAHECFADLGTVGVNSPFAGTYVPLKFYGTEPKVQSIMLEIRKDTYGLGESSDKFNDTVSAISSLLR